MQLDTATIERIVGDVLKELGTPAAPRAASSNNDQPSTVRLHETVITAALLEERLNGCKAIAIDRRALLTPSAQDLIRERTISVQRMVAQPAQAARRTTTKLIVVTPHPSIDELSIEATGELAGSTDEAAKESISAICRGEADRVVVFTDKPHRAACLANRNDRVRAAVAADAVEVRTVALELAVNVWCIDPSVRSEFELAQLWKTVASVPLTPDDSFRLQSLVERDSTTQE